MAVSVNSSGSQTCTIGTEHALATVTVAGTYQLALDLSNLANGDALEVRIKCKAYSGQSSKTAFTATYAHAQGADGALVFSPPVPAPVEFAATIKQTAGTGRAVPWAVYAY